MSAMRRRTLTWKLRGAKPALWRSVPLERRVRTAMPIRSENRARYPKDWKLRSRFVRFFRARNRCEWCGAENGQPHPVTGSKVVLTTAHVFDHRPEAASLLNLAALCQKCHNGHDAKMRRDGRKQRAELESGQHALQF